MTKGSRRALLGVAATMAIGLLAAPTAANAAETADFTGPVSVGRLVLEPTDRGYTGILPTRVRNTSTEDAYLSVGVAEPVAGAWKDMRLGSGCTWGGFVDDKRTVFCGIDGVFAPGEVRNVRSTFAVLSTPQAYAMEAFGGSVVVYDSTGNPVGAAVPFRTLFRSTTGSLKQPKPFTQDTQTDITLTAGDGVTLTRQADGSFRGRLPVTVTWRGNAPHWEVFVALEGLPSGFWVDGTDPDGGMPCFGGCPAPGAEFMQGETRTFDLIITADAATPVGGKGTASATTVVNWDWSAGSTTDVSPADNTDTFTVTVTE